MEIFLWIFVGSFVAGIIDIDAIILVKIKSKNYTTLQRFQNIKEIANDFNSFITTMRETGILKTILVTHVIFSVIIFLLFYLVLESLIMPVILGIMTHLFSDIKYIKKK
jgi:hypothetical protein